MKKYSILIKEYDERIEEVMADSYDDACNKIESLINDNTITLDPYNYHRHYENSISKLIDKNMKIDAYYDAENHNLLVTVNGKTTTIPYCFSVRNLKEDFAELKKSMCSFFVSSKDPKIRSIV